MLWLFIQLCLYFYLFSPAPSPTVFSYVPAHIWFIPLLQFRFCLTCIPLHSLSNDSCESPTPDLQQEPEQQFQVQYEDNNIFHKIKIKYISSVALSFFGNQMFYWIYLYSLFIKFFELLLQMTTNRITENNQNILPGNLETSNLRLGVFSSSSKAG